MEDPAFKYEKLFKEKNGIVFSSNYSLYGDVSSRVLSILNNFSLDVDVYSIDETFFELSNDIIYSKAYGLAIKERIFVSTGIAVSIGIATTKKTLAKVVNNVAEKFQHRTDGVIYYRF